MRNGTEHNVMLVAVGFTAGVILTLLFTSSIFHHEPTPPEINELADEVQSTRNELKAMQSRMDDYSRIIKEFNDQNINNLNMVNDDLFQIHKKLKMDGSSD